MKTKLLLLLGVFQLCLLTTFAENKYDKDWEESNAKNVSKLEAEEKCIVYADKLSSIVQLDKHQRKEIEKVYLKYFKERNLLLKSDGKVLDNYNSLMNLEKMLKSKINSTLNDSQKVLLNEYYIELTNAMKMKHSKGVSK